MGVKIPDTVTLTCIRIKSDASDGDGKAVAEVKVLSSKTVYGGHGWFDSKHDDDYFIIEIVDVDGELYPAGTVIGKFYDDTVPSSNQGWYMHDEANVGVLEEPAEVPALMYIRVTAWKGDGASGAVLRANLTIGDRT